MQKPTNFLSRREKQIKNRTNVKRVAEIINKLFPQFPTQQVYDVIMVDPPWEYERNTQKSNIPKYNQLSFINLTYLPLRRIAKENSILLLWATAPMLDKAIALMKIWGFRYVTVFQNWTKLQNGQPAKIKSGYSYGSSEFLLWGEKGRTKDLKTPDIADQILTSEITKHSEKPYDKVFQNLMMKIHLNKLKCLEVFARSQRLKYFDTYGDELQPRFQEYDPLKFHLNNILDINVTNRVDNIMSKIKCNEQDEIMQNIIKQYPHAFALSKNEIGKTPLAQHHIRMLPSAVPIRHNPYRCSPKEQEFLENEIKMLETLGCIERCEATWAMPVIMVKKKDTSDLRMCIDYRALNKNMVIENYPIPRIDYILSLLGKYKIFSKLDIKSGFWHIEIAPQCQKYTGFITQMGTFRWKVMPFGLKNAPATFQRVIEQALQSQLGKICTVYIDDIIIFSNTIEEHIKHVQEVIRLLNIAQLKLGADKCEFFQTHIDILGHHISDGKVMPQESKVQAIKDIPIPENRSQIRSFVGICSYYRSFIKDFSQKCDPLLKLTQIKVPFIWDDKCLQSFEIMKNELCIAPMLSAPHPQGQYILQTDFSEKGLGAVLNQILPNETTPRVVEYASRSLRGAEINYPAYEGEVLAIHWALQKFRHYIHGVHFTLYTDNKALSQVLESTKLSKKIIRWIIDMQEYNFTTEHRPGLDNANADALSRLFTIPDDINIKLNFGNMCVSYQAYSLLQQGNRFEKLSECQINTILSDGVGDIHCQKCQETHTKRPMLICECCGNGYHDICHDPQVKIIPPDAWYCLSCLTFNKQTQTKDITMDFEVLDYIQNKLDITQYDQQKLNSIRQKASQYKIIHNRLFYIKNTVPVLVPTIAERRLLVLEQHRVLVHPSPETLYNILRQNFYWYNMTNLIDEVTYNCQVCQARKIQNVPSSTYTPTDKGHYPFHTVSMDLATELTITNEKNRHMLIIVDNFSKLTLIIPLKNKSSQHVADSIFNHLICVFGKPKVIRVDQGNEFRGDVEDLCNRWDIQMARATTYHPQANGLAERMIQVIKRSITAAINDPEYPLPWDQACYPVQMSINAAISRATGLSPFTVVFGRVMSIPNSIIYNVPLEDFQEPDKFQLQSYMKKFKNYLNHYHTQLSQQRKKTDSYNKQQYERLNIQKKHNLVPNQLVFLKRSNTSRWSLPNIGPFIFLEYTGKNKQNAHVKNPATNVISKQHVSNISPWKVLQQPAEELKQYSIDE